MNNMSPQNPHQQRGYRYNMPNNENTDKFRIRAIRMEDAYLLSELRTMKGVFENIPTSYAERTNFNQNFINNLSAESDHVFVVESFENNQMKIIGMAGLHVNKNPRQKHSANIGIMVHTAYQGKGIGKKLMDKLIDLADNWVDIKRIELDVIADNTPAIKLYEKYGFKKEGVKKHSVFKNGNYTDVIMMARYNL